MSAVPQRPYVYGQFVGAHHVEAAVLALLYKWLPSYQYEICRDAGLEPRQLQPIRSWRVSTTLGRMPEDQLPGVILVNRGITEPPQKHGDSTYVARWEVQLGVQVAAKGKKVNAAPRALTLARMYITAIRLAMIQQRDDDGVLYMNDWRGELGDSVLESEDDRTTCLADTRFHLETWGAAQWGEGPIEPGYPPEVDPPPVKPEWWPAELVDVDVQKVLDPRKDPKQEEG